MSLADRKFSNPSDGVIFELTLGPKLEDETGITPIPAGIVGERQATASRYSIKSPDGGGYGSAESSISEDFAHLLDHIKIQFEKESGRILVTEDTSDARPVKRYILFTPTHPGYSVDYLAPKYESLFEERGFPSPPPEVILMPANRAWIDGLVLPLQRISMDKSPFSLGG